jgi:outer membrane protein
MKLSGYIAGCFVIFILFTNITNAQKVASIDSDTIREKFPEVMQAQQRIQNMTDEWKRELDSMRQKADNLEIEIKKNHLIWTETEHKYKESELFTLRKIREDFARTIFEPNGKYDQAVKTIFKQIEEKIKATEWLTD